EAQLSFGGPAAPSIHESAWVRGDPLPFALGRHDLDSKPSTHSRRGVRPVCRSPTLTMRAPEEIPARQDGSRHGSAADVTRQTLSAVDVNLAAVVVFARRAPHRCWLVFGPDGIDAPALEALAHQKHQIVPYSPPGVLVQFTSGRQGV